jgi:hypothetical protein
MGIDEVVITKLNQSDTYLKIRLQAHYNYIMPSFRDKNKEYRDRIRKEYIESRHE